MSLTLSVLAILLSFVPTMGLVSLRQRLLSGGKSYGPMLLSDSPVVAEILALTGYGHILVDHEHAPTDVRSGQALLQAVQSANAMSAVVTEPIVRLPAHDPVYMKMVLDSMRLPGGVLVPMVNDAQTAADVVASTRYPVQQQGVGDADGVRGSAVPFVRGSGWGNEVNSYMQQCEEDLLVMVQVETPRGVDEIPEIARVGGVDAIFLGPMDLSASIGKMGQFDDPEVQDLILEAEQSVLASGCLLAGFRPEGRSLQDMFESGYSLVCGSVDVGLLRNAASNDLEVAELAMAETAFVSR